MPERNFPGDWGKNLNDSSPATHASWDGLVSYVDRGNGMAERLDALGHGTGTMTNVNDLVNLDVFGPGKDKEKKKNPAEGKPVGERPKGFEEFRAGERGDVPSAIQVATQQSRPYDPNMFTTPGNRNYHQVTDAQGRTWLVPPGNAAEGSIGGPIPLPGRGGGGGSSRPPGTRDPGDLSPIERGAQAVINGPNAPVPPEYGSVERAVANWWNDLNKQTGTGNPYVSPGIPWYLDGTADNIWYADQTPMEYLGGALQNIANLPTPKSPAGQIFPQSLPPNPVEGRTAIDPSLLAQMNADQRNAFQMYRQGERPFGPYQTPSQFTDTGAPNIIGSQNRAIRPEDYNSVMQDAAALGLSQPSAGSQFTDTGAPPGVGNLRNDPWVQNANLSVGYGSLPGETPVLNPPSDLGYGNPPPININIGNPNPIADPGLQRQQNEYNMGEIQSYRTMPEPGVYSGYGTNPDLPLNSYWRTPESLWPANVYGNAMTPEAIARRGAESVVRSTFGQTGYPPQSMNYAPRTLFGGR